MTNMPEWVTVGGPAFLLETGGWSRRLVPVTITKITARDVVATGPGGVEHRYRKDSFRAPYRSEPRFHPPANSYRRGYLIGPKDPEVASVAAEEVRLQSERDARIAVDSWVRDRRDAERTRAAIVRLEAWLKVLESGA